MKRTVQAVALALWVIVASGLLTRLWLIHPEMFPEFPKAVAEYLAALYGAQNAEDIADLEILLGLLISLPIVSVFTFLAWLVWSKNR